MRTVKLPTSRNPLAAGFYTVHDAARLIDVTTSTRIYGWLRGYPDRSIGPLLERDFQPLGKKEELSFLDLMEVRFVEYFRKEGVKVQTLRRVMANARAVFKESKPLASNRVIFKLSKDRKSLFAEEVLRPAADEMEDTALWSLLNKQLEFRILMEGHLAKGVHFDPKTAVATSWTPRPETFPRITINPQIAYGQPATPSRVPTAVLFKAWEAGDGIGDIADWFKIPSDQAEEAIAFERTLFHSRPAVN